MPRVVITGAAVVSPIGSTFNGFMDGLEAGNIGVDNIKGFCTDFFPSTLGAEAKDMGQAIKDDPKAIFLNKTMDELLNNNQAFNNYLSENRFLNLGSGLDYFDLINYVGSDASQKGQWLDYSHNTHRMVGKLAEKYEIAGGYALNVSACVASSQAIGLSYRMMKNSPENKIIVTGGFDSMLNHLHYIGFYKLGAFSSWEANPKNACRPFDKDRSGIVLGEGAAVFLLQNEKDADKSKILGEIVGYSSTMDAHLITDPDPQGTMVAKAAIMAIEEAGISPNDIDCVHLHGTGTIKNDLAEAAAMEIIFGKRYESIPVFSLKAQIGHLIGACSAVELAGVIYSLIKQKVPPTINFEEAEPEIKLRVIKDKALDMKINYVLKLNAAFGGQNTAIVVKRYAT